MIQVQHQHRYFLMRPLRLLDCHAQAIGKQHAIGQAGQEVVISHMCRIVFAPLALGDVVGGPQIAADPAATVLQRAD